MLSKWDLRGGRLWTLLAGGQSWWTPFGEAIKRKFCVTNVVKCFVLQLTSIHTSWSSKRVPCDRCGKIFWSESDLNVHVNRVHWMLLALLCHWTEVDMFQKKQTNSILSNKLRGTWWSKMLGSPSCWLPSPPSSLMSSVALSPKKIEIQQGSLAAGYSISPRAWMAPSCLLLHICTILPFSPITSKNSVNHFSHDFQQTLTYINQ